jgi:hypothetical protein
VAPLRTGDGTWVVRDDVFVRYTPEGKPAKSGPLGFGFKPYFDQHHRASSGCSLPRAGHSDARLGHHEIKACRARFREDSLAADAAGEEVAEGAQAPWVGVGLVVVRHGGRRARCLYPCISAKRGSSESGEVAGQNARWEAGKAMFCAPS